MVCEGWGEFGKNTNFISIVLSEILLFDFELFIGVQWLNLAMVSQKLKSAYGEISRRHVLGLERKPLK